MTETFQYYSDTNMSHGFLFKVMGTRLDMIILGLEESEAKALWQVIVEKMQSLDARLNRFDTDSTLSQLNRLAYLQTFQVDAELFKILQDCYNYYEKTDGLFDISLSDLSKMVLSDNTVSFLSPDLKLDLGAYAKGYALKIIKNLLIEAQVKQAFVNFGDSSIVGLGHHPHGDSWKISINNPFLHNSVLEEVSLKDLSISTSGNTPSYSNHIVRPDTKRKNNERKLTYVVAADPLEAEVLSTVLMIAKQEERQKILKNFQIDSYKIFKI